MNLRKSIGVISLAIITVLAFSACDLLGSSSPSDRVNSFVAELNKSNRSNVYQNLDPKASYYNAAKASSYWDTLFPTGETYTISNISGTSLVTATLTGSKTFGSQTISFTMTASGTLGTSYLISTISYAGVTVFQ